MTFTRRQITVMGAAWLVSILAVMALCVALSGLTGQREQDLIQRGAYASWDVNNGCLDSSEACAEALARQNEELKRYGLEIMEDGSTIPIKLADSNRRIENGR